MTPGSGKDLEHSHEGKIAARIEDLLKSSKSIVTKYKCQYHPSVKATSLCECCGADICSECSHIRNHKLVCSNCMGSLDKALAGTGPAAFFTRLLTHPFVVALVLTALLSLVFVNVQGIHRKGLLAKSPENAIEAREQFRLKMLLYARKANRLETHADELQRFARYEEAGIKYDRARNIYEELMHESSDTWEGYLVSLARTRILEKMGEREYAKGLYKSIADMPGPDKTFPAIAEFRLAKLLEQKRPEQALENYSLFLRDIKYASSKYSLTLNTVAPSSDILHDYKNQLSQTTGNDFDFGEAKAEALLQSGRLLLRLGREDEAEYKLRLALDEGGTGSVGEQASMELRRLHAMNRSEEIPQLEPQKKEEIQITHFE